MRSDDFSLEIDERRRKLRKYDKMKQLLKIKDDIIWTLINEKRNDEIKEVTRMKETNYNEVSEWAKLSDKYKEQLNKFNLNCHFCEVYLDDKSVNGECFANTEQNDKKKLDSIPLNVVNTKRHYFVKPRDEIQVVMPTEGEIKLIFEQIRSQLPSYLSLEVLIGKHFRDNETASDKHFIKFFGENFDFLEYEQILKLCAYFNTSNSTLLYDKHASLQNKKLISVASVLKFVGEQELNRVGYDQTYGSSGQFGNKGTLKGSAGSNLIGNETDVVCNIVAQIDNMKINLYHELAKSDYDHDGYINVDDLRLALVKLPFTVSSKEVDVLFKYFFIKNDEKVDIKRFAKSMMEYSYK